MSGDRAVLQVSRVSPKVGRQGTTVSSTNSSPNGGEGLPRGRWGVFHGSCFLSKLSVSKLGAVRTYQKITMIQSSGSEKGVEADTVYSERKHWFQAGCQVKSTAQIERETKADLKKIVIIHRLLYLSIIHTITTLKELCKQIKTYIPLTQYYSFVPSHN